MCFIWDQVLPTDESVEHKKSHRQSHRKKVLPEIYLTRLLSTKVGAGLPCSCQVGLFVVCREKPAPGKECCRAACTPKAVGLLSWMAGACLVGLSGSSGSLQLPSSSLLLCDAPHDLCGMAWGLCRQKGFCLPQGLRCIAETRTHLPRKRCCWDWRRRCSAVGAREMSV